MTVATTTTSVRYTGNSSTTRFTVPFKFFAASHIVVVLIDLHGNASTQTLDSHYTVSGGNGGTGAVTFVAAPTVGFAVVIFRNTPPTQPVNYLTNDRFDAETHERALDRLTLIAQEISGKQARSFRLKDHDEAADTTIPLLAERAGKYAYWNSLGELTAVEGGGGGGGGGGTDGLEKPVADTFDPTDVVVLQKAGGAGGAQSHYAVLDDILNVPTAVIPLENGLGVNAITHNWKVISNVGHTTLTNYYLPTLSSPIDMGFVFWNRTAHGIDLHPFGSNVIDGGASSQRLRMLTQGFLTVQKFSSSLWIVTNATCLYELV